MYLINNALQKRQIKHVKELTKQKEIVNINFLDSTRFHP